MQRLPLNSIPKGLVPNLAALLLKQIQNTPVPERTSDKSLAKLEFADSLASLLPIEDGKKLRAPTRRAWHPRDQAQHCL